MILAAGRAAAFSKSVGSKRTTTSSFFSSAPSGDPGDLQRPRRIVRRRQRRRLRRLQLASAVTRRANVTARREGGDVGGRLDAAALRCEATDAVDASAARLKIWPAPSLVVSSDTSTRSLAREPARALPPTSRSRVRASAESRSTENVPRRYATGRRSETKTALRGISSAFFARPSSTVPWKRMPGRILAGSVRSSTMSTRSTLIGSCVPCCCCTVRDAVLDRAGELLVGMRVEIEASRAARRRPCPHRPRRLRPWPSSAPGRESRRRAPSASSCRRPSSCRRASSSRRRSCRCAARGSSSPGSRSASP